MRKTVLRSPRGMLVLLVAFLGLMGLTAGTASAQLQPGEGCVPPGDRFIVGLVDPNEDGVITLAELQTIADSLDPGEQQDTFNNLIDQAEAQGVTGLRYNITGECPPPATVGPTATTAPATVAPTATTAAPTATTAAPTATTAPGTATATTAPGTATATTAPGTATTTPDDDGTDDGGAGDGGTDDGGAGDDGTDDGGTDDGGAGDDGTDDGVSELPETGQGPDGGQNNATLIMLLGGMSLFIAAAFLWTQRRTS